MAATITGRARFFLLCVLAAAGVVLALWYGEESGDAIQGRARVVDGDSLVVGSVDIRIYGIDAPELYQTCQREGREWNCGTDASRALRTTIAGRDVSCRARDRDRYGRTVAVCHVGGLDLGAAMIKGGFAVAYGSYEADEREARDARRGIWSSTFDMPSAWRAKHPRR